MAILLCGPSSSASSVRIRLRGTLEAPPRFCDYMGACVRTGERESLADQMLGDFK